MAVSLAFHGGAGTVTGSRFLLDVDGHRVLVDCGMFQGLKELRLRNWDRPAFDPRRVDAVLLTHAHIDHSGYLPRLVQEGFRGPIYCTEGTAQLARVLLLDSARLHEEDAEYASRKGYSKHRPPLPLYTVRDAERAIGRLTPVHFGSSVQVGPVAASFHRAGHILGSAWIQVHVETPDGPHRIVFSGDVGRPEVPVLSDPEPLSPCDTLLLESTYGDREHDHAPLLDQLADAIQPTLRERGVVLIPAFAVGRSQLLIHLIGELVASGRIPHVPVHLDSPMAVEVTHIYRRHRGSDEMDAEPGDQPPGDVRYHSTVDESRTLNDLRGPRIIVSSSGMLTGGRVLHHLLRLAGDSRNLILLAGYQAAGTRGRTLADGGRIVRLHGQDILVRARVKTMDGFSAHADVDELVTWAGSAGAPPKTTFLVHGEEGAMAALAARLRQAGQHPVIPAYGQRYELVESGHWRLGGAARE